MPAENPEPNKPAATSPARRWQVVGLFLCWTAVAATTIWWLIADAANPGNTVIRVGSEEFKSWGVRLHETVALARLKEQAEKDTETLS